MPTTSLQESDLQIYLASQITSPNEQHHGHVLQLGHFSCPKPMDKTPASVKGGHASLKLLGWSLF